MSTALVGTVAARSELVGKYKICVITCPIASASDTVAISQALHGVTYVDYIIGAVFTAGMDDHCLTVEPSITSTTEITLASFGEGGLVADDWTGTSVEVSFLGH